MLAVAAVVANMALPPTATHAAATNIDSAVGPTVVPAPTASLALALAVAAVQLTVGQHISGHKRKHAAHTGDMKWGEGIAAGVPAVCVGSRAAVRLAVCVRARARRGEC